MQKGEILMQQFVTHDQMFQFALVLIALVALVVDIYNKKD